LDSNIWAAQINIAVYFKASELRRMIGFVDNLDSPAAKPILDAMRQRLVQVESLGFEQPLPAYDDARDREDYERRCRLLDMAK
jgi:hypothetical protein